ncbi:DICT sensory domain-containing protein [Halobacteriales archaeon Cl-PHB]
MDLGQILDRVNGEKRDLTLFNVDLDPEAETAITEYFEPQHVTVRRRQTDDGMPRNFAVLHDGPAVVAADPLSAIEAWLDPQDDWRTESDVTERNYPDVLQHVSDQTFSEFGKARMILASREIERRAWDYGTGTLHAGFQRLSLVASQRRTYSSLPDRDLTVHLYGLPDGPVPESVEAVIHAEEATELRDHWFVVYDGDGDDDRKAALLAAEVGDNSYSGFWTYRPPVVDAILAHLAATY